MLHPTNLLCMYIYITYTQYMHARSTSTSTSIYIYSIYYNIIYIFTWHSVADHRRSSPMESAKSLDASGTAY